VASTPLPPSSALLVVPLLPQVLSVLFSLLRRLLWVQLRT
jgi:hypothetical protein